MKYFNALFTLILVSFSLSAQEENTNLDWRALNSYWNGDYSKSISECRNLLKNQADGVIKDRTKLILARGLMEIKQFDEAAAILSSVKFDAAFLKSGVLGLIGDCKSEQEKYDDALDFYTKAIHAEFNEGTTPKYLFKAYLCAEKLGRSEEGQQYIETIRYYFPNYALRDQVDKYIVLDAVKHIPLVRPSADQPSELGIGTLNGKPLDRFKFEVAIRTATTNALQAAKQMGLDPQEVDEDEVWQSFITERIRTSEYRSLLLRSDSEELDAYLYAEDGYDPQVEFLNSPAFTSEAGTFNPDKLKARVDEMSSSSDPYQMTLWQEVKDYYYTKLLLEKYNHMVSLVVFVSNLETAQTIENDRAYSMNYYVEKDADEWEYEYEMTYTESEHPRSEQMALYETLKYSREFSTTEDQRKGYLIETDAKPTSKDTAELFSKMNALKKSFMNTKNDSLFVLNTPNNQSRFYTSGPFSTAIPEGHPQSASGRFITYPREMSSAFDAAKIGQIVGPYFFDDQLVIAKVIGRTDDAIEARHILLDENFSRVDAENFLAKVTNENFTQLAIDYSIDPGSKNKGGNLGTFFFADMVPTFATYCADAPLRQIGLVESNYGFHIVQVTKRSGKRLPRLALVQLPIKIGNDGLKVARENLEQIRLSYLAELRSNYSENEPLGERFKRIAGNNNKFADEFIINENIPRISDIRSKPLQDSLLKFMFNPSITTGDISQVYVDSNKLILAIFEYQTTAGPLPFDVVRAEIEDELIWRDESEILLEQLKKRSPSEVKKQSKTMRAALNRNELFHVGNESTIVAKAIRAYKTNQTGIYAVGPFKVVYIEVTEEEKIPPITIAPIQIKSWLYSLELEQFLTLLETNLLHSHVVVDNRDLLRLGVRK